MGMIISGNVTVNMDHVTEYHIGESGLEIIAVTSDGRKIKVYSCADWKRETHNMLMRCYETLTDDGAVVVRGLWDDIDEITEDLDACCKGVIIEMKATIDDIIVNGGSINVYDLGMPSLDEMRDTIHELHMKIKDIAAKTVEYKKEND